MENMRLQKRPFNFDFVDNNPEYVVRTNRSDADSVRLRVWLEIDEARTPDLFYEYSNGIVSIDTSMLKSLFPVPLVPQYQQYNAVRVGSNMLHARLHFSELPVGSSDSELSRVDEETSPWFWLINGKLVQYHRENNIPDWISSDPQHFYLKQDIDIFAQDNGETVLTDFSVEHYLHICNFTNTDISATPVVIVRKKDGTSETLSPSPVVFQKNSIYAVPVSLAAFDYQDVDNAVSYTVSFSNNSISRTFVRRHFDYGFHTFLMLNSMNLYESFIVEYLAKEENSEGERRVYHLIDSYGTTDSQTVFSAKCRPRSSSGLKVLHSAFAKQHNLLLDGMHAWYVDMIPGSLTVSDEDPDLVEAEFKFRLREKVNRSPQHVASVDEDASVVQIIRTDTVFR